MCPCFVFDITLYFHHSFYYTVLLLPDFLSKFLSRFYMQETLHKWQLVFLWHDQDRIFLETIEHSCFCSATAVMADEDMYFAVPNRELAMYIYPSCQLEWMNEPMNSLCLFSHFYVILDKSHHLKGLQPFPSMRHGVGVNREGFRLAYIHSSF